MSSTTERTHSMRAGEVVPSLLSLAALNEDTITTSNPTLSTSAYHGQYEKKQKNVSRLISASFVTPLPAAMDRINVDSIIAAPVSANIASTSSTPLLLQTANKGPTIFYPTGMYICTSPWSSSNRWNTKQCKRFIMLGDTMIIIIRYID